MDDQTPPSLSTPPTGTDAPAEGFDADAWEMHVAGCQVAEEPDMLLIVGMLARMAGPDGEIDIDPGSYPEGSQEQYLAALLSEMAAEDAAAGRSYTGWRLAYGTQATTERSTAPES